jgi:predicted RNA-binding Zn ribbon-like protein
MSEEPSVSGCPAPESAAAIIGLVNSRPRGDRPDRLATPRDAALALGAVLPIDDTLSFEQLERLRALREAIVGTLAADSAPDSRAAAWASVNALTVDAPLRAIFAESGSPALEQAAGDPIVGRIAIALWELMTLAKWSRLRLCANEGCGVLFYDATRSNTQRWHSYERCGNRSNVAAFRARTAV